MLPTREHLRWRTDIPVIVLEHGKPMEIPPELAAQGRLIEETLHAMQQDLASRSAKGKLRMARQSSHDIPNEEPQAVLQAIADVIAESGYVTPR
jgi:hypothetical protein